MAVMKIEHYLQVLDMEWGECSYPRCQSSGRTRIAKISLFCIFTSGCLAIITVFQRTNVERLVSRNQSHRCHA